METVVFDLDVKATCGGGTTSSGIFVVPTLPAYAVEWVDLQLDYGQKLREGQFRIEGARVIADPATSGIWIDKSVGVRLYITHHGIRDYALLFPAVADPALRKRLGDFYEEAEKNFQNGAWLSFALMCGAVFEGILWDLLGSPTDDGFYEMTQDALSMKEIDQHTADIMDIVRKHRNLVHAGKFEKPYVSRVDAMDIRTTMDKLIRKVALRD